MADQPVRRREFSALRTDIVKTESRPRPNDGKRPFEKSEDPVNERDKMQIGRAERRKRAQIMRSRLFSVSFLPLLSDRPAVVIL
jgi:hypothetical protein